MPDPTTGTTSDLTVAPELGYPTYDPCARPGCLSDYYKVEVDGDKSVMELMGELETIRAEYRDRDARLRRPPAGAGPPRRWLCFHP
jgi:hypothetical protein